MKFLNGDVWNATMVGVKYDDVTIDIKDYIESIIVMGMDLNPFDVYNGYLYKWVNDNESTGEAIKSSHSSSNLMHNFPLHTTYRHALGKCFCTIGLCALFPCTSSCCKCVEGQDSEKRTHKTPSQRPTVAPSP